MFFHLHRHRLSIETTDEDVATFLPAPLLSQLLLRPSLCTSLDDDCKLLQQQAPPYHEIGSHLIAAIEGKYEGKCYQRFAKYSGCSRSWQIQAGAACYSKAEDNPPLLCGRHKAVFHNVCPRAVDDEIQYITRERSWSFRPGTAALAVVGEREVTEDERQQQDLLDHGLDEHADGGGYLSWW